MNRKLKKKIEDLQEEGSTNLREYTLCALTNDNFDKLMGVRAITTRWGYIEFTKSLRDKNYMIDEKGASMNNEALKYLSEPKMLQEMKHIVEFDFSD